MAVKNRGKEGPEFTDWLSELDYAFGEALKTLPYEASRLTFDGYHRQLASIRRSKY
jgi:hypothetical protein